MSVYWLAGLELGIGYGSRGPSTGRSRDEDGDLVSRGCEEDERLEGVRLRSLEPGMFGRGKRARRGDHGGGFAPG